MESRPLKGSQQALRISPTLEGRPDRKSNVSVSYPRGEHHDGGHLFTGIEGKAAWVQRRLTIIGTTLVRQ